jgi:undecaprenyl pyrophosphate synthase
MSIAVEIDQECHPAVDTAAHIPKHIAIIMDGNGRWAKKQGRSRNFGRHSRLSAVSITISYRIVVEMIIKEDEILLIDIGTHDQVY